VILLTQKWLDAISWETVVELNQKLCAIAKVPHEILPQRHEQARKLWETVAAQETDLQKVLDTLRQCIEQAPFRFNNLNTFAGAAGKLLEGSARNLPPVEARILCATVSQYVEGKVGKGELRQVLHHFAKLLQAAPEAVSAPSVPAPVRAQPQAT
jgi:hypothetical protein